MLGGGNLWPRWQEVQMTVPEVIEELLQAQEKCPPGDAVLSTNHRPGRKASNPGLDSELGYWIIFSLGF